MKLGIHELKLLSATCHSQGYKWRVGNDVRDTTKRFSVFFPPEIIVKKLPKIETGQNLNIELIIRANPFNKEEKGKPIQDKEVI